MPSARVLVVDDEAAIRLAVGSFLEARGFEVAEAGNFDACVAAFRDHPPDAVILDHRLGDRSAVDLLPVLQRMEPEVPVIVLTGHGSIDLAVRAIKEGADHFFTKPVELPVLLVALERALENRRERRRHRATALATARRAPDPFVGSSDAIRRLEEQARRVAASDSPVLIAGETGTGKGVLAEWLHANGPRREEAFVDLNCAGLASAFLESELFGHQRGAFTGAVSPRAGLLEVADRGTLFLDEIGDMDLAVQPKVLKALEEKRFRRLGDARDRHVDVRLVAATNHDLGRLAAEGRFRADLYFRISTLPLLLPPLRERAEDIGPLAAGFLQQASRARREPLTLSPEAQAALRAYAWRGNIRELKNVLERAAVLADGPVLGPRDLRFEPGAEAGPAGTRATLAQIEREHIERALREEGGRVAAAASRLGIPRSSLYAKVKLHGIALPRGRQGS